ncbi:MAG: hypothetical protein KBD12_00565 [Candidatus Pacebacteria bacterium]|nr:hypothetical protein [Candidatus Paceibacterota bacterium]
MKKIITILLTGFMIATLSSTHAAKSVKAEPVKKSAPVKQELLLAATVNVYSASTTKIDDSNYSVYFQIFNRVGTQSNIRYGLELTSTIDGKVYDSKLANESLTLKENQTMEIRNEYKIPTFIPNGNYKLSITVKNQNGLTLAYVPAGFPEKIISVSGKSEAPIIDNCSLTIATGTDKFSNTQNIGVNIGENINATCNIKSTNNLNYSGVKIKLITHKRDIFGDILDSKILDNSIDIKSGSSNTIDFSISTAASPQLYYVDMFLVDSNGSKLSQSTNIYYTVKGDSITLTNVVVESLSVKKGGKTTVKALWNYFGNFSPKSYTIMAVSKDANGTECGSVTKSILPSNNVIKTTLEIVNKIDCENSTILVSVLDNKGSILDSSATDLTNQKSTVNIDENTPESSILSINSVNKYYLVIFIVVLVLLGYGILKLKKEHTDINNK